MTAILALTTSLLFGCGDFLGGFAARRESAFAVTAYSHILGGTLLLIVTLLMPKATASGADLGWGLVAGISGMIGIVSMYRAMAIGRMSVVAPITAALSGALPATFDLVLGVKVGAVASAGMVLAIVSVVLVSLTAQEDDDAPGRTSPISVALSALAGVGFAGGFIAFSMTDPASGLWPLLAARVASASVALVFAFALRRHLRLDGSAVAPTVGAGLVDATANVTILTAIRIGPLAVASVLASLYPIVVVILARMVFGERLKPMQVLGAGLAVLAIALTAIP